MNIKMLGTNLEIHKRKICDNLFNVCPTWLRVGYIVNQAVYFIRNCVIIKGEKSLSIKVVKVTH